MKIKKQDSANLRRVLIGMVTDPVVVSRLSDRWEDAGLFGPAWANLVAWWCIRYFRKYEKPIGLGIESTFDRWAEDRDDKDTVQMIAQFLLLLSEEHDPDEPLNSEYLLDLAKEQIQIAQIKKLNDTTENLLLIGRVQEAQDAVTSYREVNLGLGSYVEPHTDFSAWVQAFEHDDQKALFRYPGELGRLIGGAMHRDALISWMGVEKAGKSYTLVDATVRALRKRLRVAYFEAGDLGQSEVITRIGERITGKPRRRGIYRIPYTEVDDKAALVPDDVLWDERLLDDTVGPQSGYKAYKDFVKDKSLLRISSHPNSSLSTLEIDGMINQWTVDGWPPDVIVIDYADILAPNKGIKDPLDQIDDIWKHLRRISQKWHCLVLTATQASANAYDQTRPLTRKNFSGRKTKLAHVNGMIGLNVGLSSKEDDDSPKPINWNWIVRRNDYSNENWLVSVFGCLGIGRPVLLTAPKKRNRKNDGHD